MGKFSGVLLATDYDDTLYDSKGTISPENRAAIDRFLAEGGLFSISTGRSYINFVIQMEREKLPVNAPFTSPSSARPSRSWALRPTTRMRSTPSGPTSSPTVI